MERETAETKIMQTLDWVYEKAIDGVPGLGSAEGLAQDYMKADIPTRDQINSLIRWQNAKCATSGFMSGLGGVLTMPVTVPANIASVMYVQIRMIAAIAHICGHDIRDVRCSR